jgi:ribosomal-protein-alanine N-acetyltransferase
MVRLFRPPDMEAILRIERASFGSDAYDRKLFAEFHQLCGDLFLVTVSDTRICGYMITSLGGSPASARGEIISVAVAPKFRGQGAASSLMKSTFRRLRLRGATRLNLMVRKSNQVARHFYEHYGFRKLRRVPGYYSDGEDGVLMSATLTAARNV